ARRRFATLHEEALPVHAATKTETSVAYAGGAAAHSAAGAEKLFPGSELVALGTFVDVVRAVLNGECGLGVLPIESSLAGPVAETHDLLWEHALSIVGETSIPVKHLLVARKPLALADSRVDGTEHEGWRTAFSFVTDHRPAALFHAIEPFAAHGVDLLQLVSRPIPQSPFTYRFDAVLAGHPSDPVTRLALSEVRGRTRV